MSGNQWRPVSDAACGASEVGLHCMFSPICLKHKCKYIEDIYSFEVNTRNICMECNENISIFTSAKHE